MGIEGLMRTPAGTRARAGEPAGGQHVATARRTSTIAALPDDLAVNIESMSGVSLDDVRVHHDSPEPGRVGALAFARGADIHLASGQEEHLPHEAWHVVQQAQGRVAPTTRLDRGEVVNTDSALEREAEAMGAKATRIRRSTAPAAPSTTARSAIGSTRVIQRMQNSSGKIVANTLVELNKLLKQILSTVTIALDDFDETPKGADLDKAIAASKMVIEKSTSRKTIVAELQSRMTQGSVAAEKASKEAKKDPLAARKLAAKLCSSEPGEKGDYYGGGANELHVHDLGGEFHLKGPGGTRKNIYTGNKLHKDVLAESRKLLIGHGLADVLNAAIDKALIEHKFDLDLY